MRLRRIVGFCFDLILAALSFLTAFAIVHGHPNWADVPGIYDKTFAFVSICAVCFLFFGVDRSAWRYASISDLVAVIKTALAAVVVYTVGAFIVSRGDNVPRSVLVLTGVFMIVALSSVRLAYRLIVDGDWLGHPFNWANPPKGRAVVLLGLSHGAESYIRAAKRAVGDRIHVAGILDEDPLNRSRIIHGIKVHGALADLPHFLTLQKRHSVDVRELIVTERQPSRQRLSEIVEAATGAGLKVSRIPDLTVTASITNDLLLQPKPIDLGDLLGRPEIVSNLQGIAKLINDRVVLATGAGGSIGSELCRQIASFQPRLLVITDNSEHAIYLLDKELRGAHPDLPIVTRIVDVRDRDRVGGLFAEYRPEVVFHAAALKHVPLVEKNPLEGIKTNVLGTRNVADAAVAHETSTFVMISTDKAVNPTNVMGATKRAAEAYCQTLDLTASKTRFKTVRFGNVLGSNGSVVPRFQEQIAAGGPVTVTHPHIVRYFMTIPEAVRLVLFASSHALAQKAERGKIMVLDMGKPVRIVDLAERMIQLAGYRPRVDIDIVFTGLRPGEKLFEELFDPSEILDGKTAEGYVVAAPRVIDAALLNKVLGELEQIVRRGETERALQLLRHIVPEYRNDAFSSEEIETYAVAGSAAAEMADRHAVE